MTTTNLIYLQHTVGNRAVCRLVQRAMNSHLPSPPPTIIARDADDNLSGPPKAVMKDALNLASPKLAGDTELESCLDGHSKHYLRPGHSGPHVKKVQEALIGLGFPISSPIGTYGTETYKAVKAFQAKAGMSGKDVDGIVGKKTIALLDAASRREATETDVDEKSADFKVEGKYPDAGEEENKDTLFFKLASSKLDEDESKKARKFAEANAGKAITLEGFASEEGTDAVNKALIKQRIDKTAAEIATVKPGPIKIHTLRPNVSRAKGEIKYRQFRKVELKAGHITEPTKKEESCAIKNTETCDDDRSGRVKTAASRAQELIGAAQKKLPPTGANAALFDKLYGTDNSNRKETASKLNTMSSQVISHIGTLPDKSKHFCGKKCHSGCQSGWIAYNTDKRDSGKPDEENPSGIMTLCPKFFEKGDELQALILVHEGHHGTPGFHSKDYAYHHERLIFLLDPETALKNAASFHLFVLKFSGSTIKEDKPKITAFGPSEEDIYSEMLIKNPKQKAALHKAIAWIEHWVKFVDSAVSHAYAATEEARRTGRWPTNKKEPNRGGTKIMKHFIAKRFELTRPYSRPTEKDQAALAAMFDRIRQMAKPFDKALSFSVGKDEWERGPKAKVSVSKAFLSLKPSQQTTILLQELVRATPGISAALEPEYVAFIEEISQEGYKWIGPQT